MNKFSILVGKVVVFIGKVFNRGSVLPGSIVLKLNKNIWSYFKLPKTIIAVTGSSGKGSVCKSITKILESNNIKVAYNYKGSNIDIAILTLLIEQTNLKGNIKSDALVLEVDERYCKYVFPHVKPTHVVITNITRDQPPRQGNVDLVFKEIKKSLSKDMHLILNGDDPYLKKFDLNNELVVSYFGLDKTKYSYTKNSNWNLNLVYCPKCNKKLVYGYYHFENIGKFHCPNCDFKNSPCDYSVTKMDYTNNTITINDKNKIKLSDNMLYFIYNILAAYTVGSILKLNNKVLEDIDNSSNHLEYKYKKRNVYVLNNKAENSTTYNQSLLFTKRDRNKKVIVLGWKEISRRYNFDDLSWLYDIDFEILKDSEVEAVICMGINCYDIGVRLKYAGIDEAKIKPFMEVIDATEYIKKKTKSDIYAILNFDHVIPFNDNMKEVK